MSGDVAKLEQAPAPVQTSATGEASAIISMIERAARDPSVDIDKMERLYQMHEAAEARRAKADYIASLSVMQPKLPVIDKRGEIARKAKNDAGVKEAAKATKYAKWEDVVEAISPVLAEHGFSLSFRIKQDQRVEVTAVLGHKGGHCEETSMSLPIDDSGAKNNHQGWGSSISYGKRYTAFALLNIVARGEDDDGQAAGDKPSTTTVEDITKLIDDTKTERTAILQHYSVETLEDLNGKQRDEIKSRLTTKLALMRKQKNG